ncbi:MAG: branched-chain amino acid ABC transporter permease [Lachnospiraceae bacterium]|nr:branched-chain amino acid ABC transporter permease [Lachnospiraceae bacterium]
MKFISALINGVNLGSIYAIIALGYTMVYGIAKMLNFAHGDVIMIGGYITFEFVYALQGNIWVAMLVTVLACTVLGIVVEKIAYKPLRKASPLAVLITAIGVSYFLQNIILVIKGSDTKKYESVINVPNLVLADGELIIKGTTIVTIVTCLVIMVGLTLFINKTKTGRSMLAVSEDKGAAQLMGINVNRTISITFAIGSALAAIASFLYFSAYDSLTPMSGSMPGIKAFIAAVFGGIGSIPGALIGGITLGVIEIFAGTYISTNMSEAIVFLVLILMLNIKPTGILGKKFKEKV